MATAATQLRFVFGATAELQKQTAELQNQLQNPPDSPVRGVQGHWTRPRVTSFGWCATAGECACAYL